VSALQFVVGKPGTVAVRERLDTRERPELFKSETLKHQIVFDVRLKSFHGCLFAGNSAPDGGLVIIRRVVHEIQGVIVNPEQALGLKAGIHSEEAHDALGHQTRSGQKDDGESDLGDDQAIVEQPLQRTTALLRGGVFQRLVQVGSCGKPGRGGSE